MTAAGAHLAGALRWGPWLLLGCILPDRDIRIESGIDNESAVRIVQRAPMLPEMDELCNREDDFDPSYCPQVQRTRPSGLIMPSEGDFCVCTDGDRRAIDSFEVYAEDADRDGDAPADTIVGVALIDPDTADDYPWDAVAYDKYWQPGRAGERISDGEDQAGDRTAPPGGRTPVGLTVFQLDDASGSGEMDLCNDAGIPLGPGLHTLRFMVTDRPFFRPRLFVDGEPQVTADGDAAFGPEQWGVPDLAAGASYATIDYVFECRDPNDVDAECLCDEGDG